MPAPGERDIEELRQLGFSEFEVKEHIGRESDELRGLGFSPAEVDAHWGKRQVEQVEVDRTAKMMVSSAALFDREPQSTSDSVINWLFQAGMAATGGARQSIPGMLATQEAPESSLPPDAGVALKTIEGIGMLAGDFPFMAAGFLGGGLGGLPSGPGAVVTGTAAAFALPAGLREVLTTLYRDGKATSFDEFWDRLWPTVMETGKGGLTGAATGVAGVGGRAVVAGVPGLAPTGALIPTAAELGAMVSVPAFLEGRLPTLDEFLVGGFTLGLLKFFIGTPSMVRGSKGVETLTRIYDKTGKRPQEVVQDALRDPSISEDLHSTNHRKIPRSYRQSEKASRSEEGIPISEASPEVISGEIKTSPTSIPSGEAITQAPVLRSQVSTQAGETVGGASPITRKALPSFSRIVESGADFEPLGRAPSAPSGKVGALIVQPPGSSVETLVQRATEFHPRVEPLLRKAIEEVPGAEFVGSRVKELGKRLATKVKREGAPDLVGDYVGARISFWNIESVPAIIESLKAIPGARIVKFNPFPEGRKNGHQATHLQLFFEAEGISLEVQIGTPRMFRAVKDSHPDYELVRGDRGEIGNIEVKEANARMAANFKAAERPDGEMRISEVTQKRARESREPPTIKEDIDATMERVRFNESREPFWKRWDFGDFYRSVFNRHDPLAKVFREIDKGMPEDVVNSAMNKARLHLGVSGKVNHWIDTARLDFKTGKRTGKSLREVLAPMEGRSTEARSYLINKRVVELDARGLETGFDVARATRVVKELGPEMEAFAKDVREFRTDALKYFKDAGMLSAEKFELMLEWNKEHIPFARVMDQGKGKGNVGEGLSTASFRFKGSKRPIWDPFEALLGNTDAQIRLAELNGVRSAFIDKAAAAGIEGVKRVVAKTKPIVLSKAETARILKRLDEGKPLTEAQQKKHDAALDEVTTIFRPETITMARNRIVRYKDGVREVWEVPQEIAEALGNFDAAGTNAIMKMIALPAKALRTGATLAPEFSFRNPFRDAYVAYMQSNSGFKPWDVAWGAVAVARKTRIFTDWQASGGAMAELVALDRTYRLQTIQEIMGETGVMKKTRNVVTRPLEMLQIISQTMEQATRVAEFGLATRGRAESIRSTVSPRDAMFRDLTRAESELGGLRSRDISVDFGRMGARMSALQSITAFMGSQLQGADILAKTFIKNPGRTAVRGGIAITLPSVILRMTNEGEEGFDEIPRWQKDLFWVFPTGEAATGSTAEKLNPFQVVAGDRIWWRIPKPFQYGLLFGTLPERVVEFALNKDPAAFDDFLKTLAGSFVPSVFPTFLQGPAETYFNKSIFTDRPIIPRRSEGLLSELQYNAYTTPLTRAIGSFFGRLPGLERSPLASPAVIDHMVRSWSGGLGTHFMNIADQALQKAGVLPDPLNPRSTLADIPIIKAFVIRHPSSGSEPIIQFWKKWDKVRVRLESIKSEARKGNVEASMELQQRFGSGLIDLSGLAKGLGRMSSTAQMIDMNPAIDRDEKRQNIDDIYRAMSRLAKSGNVMLDALEE